MAVVDGPVGNFSYDVMRRVFDVLVSRPLLRHRLAADVAQQTGTRVHRRRLATLLACDEAFVLVCARDAEGMGRLLAPAARDAVHPVVFGRAAIDAVRARASRATQMVLAQLDQGRSLQDGQAVLFEQLCQVIEDQSETPPLRVDPRARELRPTELVERDDDIDDLCELTEATAGYVVVVGRPWAGKTAVMAEIVLDPPDEWDVVSFFVREVGRRNTAEHFLDVVNRQLCHLLDEREDGQDLSRRRATFEELWSRAVARAETSRRQLVLLIDGLDEQNSRVEVPISALLPALVTHWAHVVVATRPNPRRHRELEAIHPYHRACLQPYVLEPSDAAGAIADLAGDTIRRIARRGEPRTRDVLGLLTVADGPLTAPDLASLVGCDLLDLEATVAGLERHLVGDGTPQHPWELGHVELLRTALIELSDIEGLLDRCERRVDEWADGYHTSGWPETTPSYLLGPYASMLVRRRLSRRVAWLISDQYELRVRTRHRTRQRLIDAVTAALGLYDSPDTTIEREDIGAICTLGLRRTEMLESTAAVPEDVVGGWAQLGAWDDVDRRLDQITVDDRQLGLAITAASTVTYCSARTLERHIDRIDDVYARDPALARVAAAVARQDPTDPELLVHAEQQAQRVEHPTDRCEALAGIAAAVARADPRAAQRLLTRAEQSAERLGSAWDRYAALIAMVRALVRHPPTDPHLLARAERIADQLEEPDYRDPLLADIAEATARCDPADSDLVDRAKVIAARIGTLHHRAEALSGIASAISNHDPDASRDLIHQAERTIEGTDAWPGASAWSTIAVAVAHHNPTDPDLLARANELDPWHRGETLAAMAAAVAEADSDMATALIRQAEEAAARIDDSQHRSRTLARVAAAVADTHPRTAQRLLHQAELTAERIDTWAHDVRLSAVAVAIAHQSPTDPDLATQVEQIADRIGNPLDRARTLTWVGATVAHVGSAAAHRLLARAEQTTDQIDVPEVRCRGLLAVAATMAPVDPAAAQTLLARAEQTIDQIDAWRKREMLVEVASAVGQLGPPGTDLAARIGQLALRTPYLGEDGAVLAAGAIAVARREPELTALTEQIAGRIDNPRDKSRALAAVAAAHAEPEIARRLLNLAEEAARSFSSYYSRTADETLARALKTMAQSDPKSLELLNRAERMAQSIEDRDARAEALTDIATALARHDPGDSALLSQAEQLADRIDHPSNSYARTWALAHVATAMLEHDPVSPEVLAHAERIADDVSDHEVAELQVRTAVVTALALSDPDNPELLARVEQLAERQGRYERYDLASIATAVVRHDPSDSKLLARAEQVVERMKSPLRYRALAAIAGALTEAGPAVTDLPQRERFSSTSAPMSPQTRDTWRFLSRLARHHGFGDGRILRALVMFGGDDGCRAVLGRVLASTAAS